jgi:homoserine kinase type II
MAVYTQVTSDQLASFLSRYDLGEAISFKGIAEGVQNSNYFVETTRGRYFLTLYEARIDLQQLPYFLELMTHLADKGLPVPRPITDLNGIALQTLAGRPACLIEYLNGVSVNEANTDECFAAGAALGSMHVALADFTFSRTNDLGLPGWHKLANACAARADELPPGLPELISGELPYLDRVWPYDLPKCTVHADLFPDNLMFTAGRVSALIDFYFACTDIRAYDLAVMHGAWCFSTDGSVFFADRAAALIAGYRSAHPLSEAERAAMSILCRGAALRFLLTRAYDWINTPANALVTRKPPEAFSWRLKWYQSASLAMIFGEI